MRCAAAKASASTSGASRHKAATSTKHSSRPPRIGFDALVAEMMCDDVKEAERDTLYRGEGLSLNLKA
jgi:hypothetical protein